MFCMKCGARNPDEATFCIQCGAGMATRSGAGGTQWVAPPAPPPEPQPSPYAAFTPPPAAEPYAGYPPQPAPARTPTEPARRTKQKRSAAWKWVLGIGVALAALVLLVVAAAVTAFFLLGLNRRERTAHIVPANTALLVSISPDPRQAVHWRDWRNLEALAPVAGAEGGLTNLVLAPADVLDEIGIDPQRDLLPWIGPEVSLAVMAPEATGGRDTPPMLLTVATRNQGKSDAFLKKVQQVLEQDGATFREDVYQGVRVVYMEPDYEGAFAPAFATVDKLVVMGSDREAVQMAIDGSEGRWRALADEAAYREVLNALPGNRAGFVYVDGALLDDLGLDEEGPIPAQALRGLGLSFALAGNGLRLDLAASFDRGALDAEQRRALEMEPTGTKGARMVPDDAVAFLAGQNLAGLLERLPEENREEVGWSAEDLEDETGVNFVDDILRYLSGEFGVALVPDRGGLFGDEDLPFGLLVWAETDARDRVESALDDLARALEEEGAERDRERVGKTDVTLVRDEYGDFEVGYGFQDGSLVFGSSLEVLRAALGEKRTTLAGSDEFRAATGPLPGRAGLVLFADLEQAIRLATRDMDDWERQEFEETAGPYVERLRAVGLGLQGLDDKGMWRGTISLVLAPER